MVSMQNTPFETIRALADRAEGLDKQTEEGALAHTIIRNDLADYYATSSPHGIRETYYRLTSDQQPHFSRICETHCGGDTWAFLMEALSPENNLRVKHNREIAALKEAHAEVLAAALSQIATTDAALTASELESFTLTQTTTSQATRYTILLADYRTLEAESNRQHESIASLLQTVQSLKARLFDQAEAAAA